MTRKVALVQVNYQYGQNVFVPYAVGSLQAYALSIPRIASEFVFQDPIFLREDPDVVVSRMDNPDVVGVSCYLWNWEYNKVLAEKVRKAYPRCLIIFGGEQVPDRSEGFFNDHPYVDILVHQEGEISFAAILEESLHDKPDYTKIAGLSIQVDDKKTLKTDPSVRIKDLAALPSPYLTGVFDSMVGKGYGLNVTQETNRGCPFSCTFCDWGGATLSKLYRFETERIHDEFMWFAGNKVEYVFNADANYGIFPRDVELVKKLIETRAEHGGYPIGFRMCTAKNADKDVFALVKELNDAGMNKGATLSFQSMDKETLQTIKRGNIRMDGFNHWMDEYAKAGIATYTELIMGMPGETYRSTKDGVDVLFASQADAVNLYAHACTALTNSEMSEPLYMRLHGIKTVRMPILLAHSTPDAGITEYHDVIIETKTMPHQDWLRTYMFYWAIQCFHCLGLTKHISILLHRQCGVGYSDFYEQMVEYFAKKPETLIGGEILHSRSVLEAAVQGGRLDRVDEEFGELYWPLEEMSFLVFVKNKERFFAEIATFLRDLEESGVLGEATTNPDFLEDIVRYQAAILKDPYVSEVTIDLRYDLPRYFKGLRSKENPLIRTPVKLKVRGKSFPDVETFAREVVWYGRRGGSFHNNKD